MTLVGKQGTMLDLLTTIGGIAAALNATLIFIVAVFKPIRKALIGWIQTQAGSTALCDELREIKNILAKRAAEDKVRDGVMQDQAKAMKWVLRGNIVSAYERCMQAGCMTPKGREELVEDHAMYKAMGGNSYIDVIYPELLELPVDSSSK